MKEFSIQALARIIKAQPAKKDGFFTGVSTDSRTIKEGDCFFAITGENFDGHDYIQQAFDKGAVCAVASEDFTGERILKVPDTIKALGLLAKAERSRNNYKVVAITGSTGKTTTRQIIAHVLRQRYRVFESPANFNNSIGVPLTFLAAGEEDEIIVAELGTSSPGEIAYLSRIAQPDIAIITNVYCAHLAGFGSLEAIVKEKLSIADGLKDDATLIINGDFDCLTNACRDRGIRFSTFGKSGTQIRCRVSGSVFTVDGTEVELPLPSEGNVENALAAWALCRQFGITIDQFSRSIKTLPAVPMRTQWLQIGTLKVLNDCYNANPASMKNALDIMTRLNPDQNCRKVFICGDMAELGPESAQMHEQLGRLIAKANIDLLLTVGRLAAIAGRTAKSFAKKPLQLKCFQDTHSVCDSLQELIKNDDIILVKGSRTAKLETVVAGLKKVFS